MRICPECRAPVEQHARFCDNCGRPLTPAASTNAPAANTPSQVRRASAPAPARGNSAPPVGVSVSPVQTPTGNCAACGYINTPGEAFCQNCGMQLAPPNNQPVSSPAPVTASSQQHAPALSAPAPAPLPAAQVGTCSACGYVNVLGETFCQNCGVQLAPVASAPPPPPMPVSAQNIPPQPPAPYSAPAAPSESSSTSTGSCPACGYTNHPGEAYCQNCGVQLTPAASAPLQSPMPFSQAAPVSQLKLPKIGPEATGLATPGSCPGCGYINASGESFCQNCGSQLASSEGGALPVQDGAGPIAAPVNVETKPVSDRARPGPAAQATGRLVIYPNGAQISLPTGKAELTIGRSDPVRGVYPDIDLTGYSSDSSGVSRMHARLLVQADGQICIEDLNSTNFTFVNKLRLQPGQSYPLKRGDEIRLGLLTLEYLDT